MEWVKVSLQTKGLPPLPPEEFSVSYDPTKQKLSILDYDLESERIAFTLINEPLPNYVNFFLALQDCLRIFSLTNKDIPSLHAKSQEEMGRFWDLSPHYEPWISHFITSPLIYCHAFRCGFYKEIASSQNLSHSLLIEFLKNPQFNKVHTETTLLHT